MAKKKQELSPEERLATALVPEEEQPYQLPEGWKWVRLGKIYDVNPKVQADDDLDASFITMSDICPGMKSQFDSSTKKWGEIKRGHTQFANGDVAFAKISPCFENRKSMILDGLKNGIGAGTTELIVLRNSQIDNKYTFLFVSSEEFIRRARNTYKGVVGQQRINLDFVKNYPMPLPPRDEQKRIVARIESLFTKLDVAKKKVQYVLDAHEARKAALLRDAFTGKLTAKWRRENNLPQDWKHGKLLDCLLEKPRNGYSPKAVDYPTKCKSMSLSATTDGIFKSEHYKYIDEEIPEDSYLWLKPGDILIQRSNSLEKVGTAAIYTGKVHEFIYPDLMMKLQIDEQNNPSYINYFLQRAETREYFLSNATGIAGNMPKINQKTVSNTPVDYPSLVEQQEIVRILDRLLGREETVRQSAESVLESIDRMKQSILARAFRGEL